jgi:hypothetical protein
MKIPASTKELTLRFLDYISKTQPHPSAVARRLREYRDGWAQPGSFSAESR